MLMKKAWYFSEAITYIFISDKIGMDIPSRIQQSYVHQ